MRKTRLLIIVVAVALVLVGVRYFTGDCSRYGRFTVRGSSMAGIVDEGDTINVRMGYYGCHEPERGDVALIKYSGNADPLVKKIVGMPGDALTFAKDDYGGYLVLNGVPLLTTKAEFFYIDPTAQKLLGSYLRGGKIPPGVYLILGNQPVGSTDSRDFGMLGKKQFLGKVY